jgi:hypothetical protein
MNLSYALLGALLLIVGTASAQDEAAVAPAAGACGSEKHRQFDFWLGHWDVTSGGQPAGRNHIELIHGGCVLAEHWVSTEGDFAGSSLNMYDKANDKWHQTWVDTGGTLLELDGGFTDGNMVMSGTRPGPDGQAVTNRITWTRNEDGSVRQHWETSTDGETWTTAFDGLYVREAGQK